jgi:hypothetical protein
MIKKKRNKLKADDVERQIFSLFTTHDWLITLLYSEGLRRYESFIS